MRRAVVTAQNALLVPAFMLGSEHARFQGWIRTTSPLVLRESPSCSLLIGGRGDNAASHAAAWV
jgi:hypothetical protein